MKSSKPDISKLTKRPFIQYVGTETDLIFNKGINLPGFASYPLLETDKGRKTLSSYYEKLIGVAEKAGVGVILDTVTWVASQDRGSMLGHESEYLNTANLNAVKLVAEIRDRSSYGPILLSAQMGPRGDGYVISDRMSPSEAETYHSMQMKTLSQTNVDFVSAFTLNYPEEAIGIIRAGRRHNMPVSISFTVETDGRLPIGISLAEAVEQVDVATDSEAICYLVNCAHPDHLRNTFNGGPWMKRLAGIVANASRCSHAELDEALELDEGDPRELGQQLGEIKRNYPHMTIFGGCCGTDMRHMGHIAEHIREAGN